MLRTGLVSLTGTVGRRNSSKLWNVVGQPVLGQNGLPRQHSTFEENHTKTDHASMHRENGRDYFQPGQVSPTKFNTPIVDDSLPVPHLPEPVAHRTRYACSKPNMISSQREFAQPLSSLAGEQQHIEGTSYSGKNIEVANVQYSRSAKSDSGLFTPLNISPGPSRYYPLEKLQSSAKTSFSAHTGEGFVAASHLPQAISSSVSNEYLRYVKDGKRPI